MIATTAVIRGCDASVDDIYSASIAPHHKFGFTHIGTPMQAHLYVVAGKIVTNITACHF